MLAINTALYIKITLENTKWDEKLKQCFRNQNEKAESKVRSTQAASDRMKNIIRMLYFSQLMMGLPWVKK